MASRTSTSKNRTELLVALKVDVLRNDEDVFQNGIEKRDDYTEPDFTHEAFGRLRILPQEAALGPVEAEPVTPVKEQPQEQVEPQKREEYGPKPKVYGPRIERPPATTTAGRPVFGPRIARSEGFKSG